MIRPTSGPTRHAAHPVLAQADTPAAPAAVSGLPVGLAGPVDLALAKAVNAVPGPHALPGGSRWELKWDGYRGAVVVGSAGARLWSRHAAT